MYHPLATSCVQVQLVNSGCNSYASSTWYSKSATDRVSCCCYSVPAGYDAATALGYWVPNWYDNNIDACVSYFSQINEKVEYAANLQATGFCSTAGNIRAWPSAEEGVQTVPPTVTVSTAATPGVAPSV